MRFSEIYQAIINEVNMSPKANIKNSAAVNARCGIEFEMIASGVMEGRNGSESVEVEDTSPESISHILDFFSETSSRSELRVLRSNLDEEYGDWRDGQIVSQWKSEGEEYIYNYILKNDDDDIISNIIDAAGIDSDSDDGTRLYSFLIRGGRGTVPDHLADISIQLKTEFEDRASALAEEAMSEKNDLYDELLEQFRDDWDDNDTEESDWLNDQYSWMSSVASRHSLDFPTYENDFNDGEHSDDAISEAMEDTSARLAEIVRRPVHSLHGHGQRHANRGIEYILEEDSSLTGDDSEDLGMELVSPVLSLDEMIADLRTLHRELGRRGFYTNDSCGLHMNVSVPNLANLDYTKLALFLGDNYILETYGRALNNYCQSSLGKIKSAVVKDKGQSSEVLNKLKGGFDALAAKTIHSGITPKYVSINNHGDRVEFRGPGGDWLSTNVEVLVDTLRRTTVALSIACDPQAYRQEYLKKLYKLLAPTVQQSGTDIVAAFARLAVGALTKDQVVNLLRQRNQERAAKSETKKGYENIPTFSTGRAVNTYIVGGFLPGSVGIKAVIFADSAVDAALVAASKGFGSQQIMKSSHPQSLFNKPVAVEHPHVPNLYAIYSRSDDNVFHIFSAQSSEQATELGAQFIKDHGLRSNQWTIVAL